MGMLQKQLPGFTLFPAHVTPCALPSSIFYYYRALCAWRAVWRANECALTGGEHVGQLQRTPKPLSMAVLEKNLPVFALFPPVTGQIAAQSLICTFDS